MYPILNRFELKADEREYDLLVSFISLYLLSAITYPHFAYTRYPDGKIKPSDYYEDKIEIVKCVNEILAEVELCISVFEQSYGSKGDGSYAFV